MIRHVIGIITIVMLIFFMIVAIDGVWALDGRHGTTAVPERRL